MNTELMPTNGDSQLPAIAELNAAVQRLQVVIRRRWRTFIAVFVLAAFSIQLVAFMWPGTFEARAAVLLQKTRFSSGIDSDPKQQTTVITGTVSEEEVNSEIAVLTSRKVLEATSIAAGLDRITPSWYIRLIFSPLRGYERMYAWMHNVPYATPAQRALAGLADSISVERLKESNILVVSYRAGDPRFAEIVLNELLKQYLNWHVSVHSQMDVQPFFTEQAELLRKEVVGLQDNLQQMKASLGVADITVERELAMKQHAMLSDEAQMLRRQAVELDGKVVVLRRATAADQSWTKTSTTSRGGSETLNAMNAQVLQLELDQIKLESRYTGQSPLVVENKAKLEAARRSIEEARRNMSEESTVGLNPTLVALQQDLARLTAERAGQTQRLRVVEQQLADSQQRLIQLDQKSIEAERLQLQLQSAKDRYLMYLDRTEKARVDAALDRSRVANGSLVQSADASLKPIRPKRLITLIVSIGAGLGIAALVCAWLELMAIGLAATLASAAPRSEALV
jgi:uncharacterized protein involved in exopolysaccharide biosynthesis